MNTEIGKLYEMMSKINPDFKLNEDTFNTSFEDTNDSTNNDEPTDINSGDVKAYEKAMDNSTALVKSGSKIDTPNEFQGAFKVWFTKLGYIPSKGNMTISNVTSQIRDVLLSLGYK